MAFLLKQAKIILTLWACDVVLSIEILFQESLVFMCH